MECPAFGCVVGTLDASTITYFILFYFPVAKIIPPHDSGIAGAILENLAPWEGVDVSEAAVRGKFCLRGGVESISCAA